MKSLFNSSMFGGGFAPMAPLQGAAPAPLKLTQLRGSQLLPPVQPHLGQSQDDITGLSRGIEDLLKLVPASALGTYQQQYTDCQSKLNAGGLVGLTMGGKCLYDLYQKLKDLVKNGSPTTPIPMPLPAPAPFPVLPVAIASVGALVLVYGLTKL